ncbi:MAG: ATP-binding cassette domain-containing protein [Chlorobi bacterium]|nr:ATP-binding cassette domain-containing protein [Chlorobiota bacterium]
MVSINNITLSFGGKTLLNDISFVVNKKDRIGLTGKNGAGKSTLMKIITGSQEVDRGTISYPSGLKIGYLPQQMNYPVGKTVLEETLSTFSEINNLENRIQSIGNQLAQRYDYHSDEYLKLIEQLNIYEEQFNFLGGHSIHGNIEKTLKGLGFEQEDFERNLSEFSGGWRMRVELAKILLQKPALLLLDEPTNHLDIESIEWLEQVLMNYPGAVMLISHDRTFLDNITKRTIEISLGKIYDYKVPYSKYEVLHKERIEQQTAAYENQQKKIKDTEQFIGRFRAKATKAVQVQSRIKQLEKIERIEIDKTDISDLHFKFPPAPHSGELTLDIENLTKKYDEKLILRNLNLTIERGQKIAFAGKNGAGKSTLIKVIIGETDFSGTLKSGHMVKIGYYAQNQEKELDENKTVFETLDDIARGEVRTKLRGILGNFLFSDDDIEKKVAVLSGGERSRLALAKLMLEPYNFLILDEPTNHLDIHSKDVLKQALLQYDGTLIVVSHDRYFLDGLVDEIYEFSNHIIKKHAGDIKLFLQKKKKENIRQFETKTVSSGKNDVDSSKNKQLYLKRKEIEKEIRKTERKHEELEKRIEELENFIAECEDKLSSGKEINDKEFWLKFEDAKKEVDKKMILWDELTHIITELSEEKEKYK